MAYQAPSRGNLFGRAAELAAIDRRLAMLREGAGSVVLLSGDAGIGKTTLAVAGLDRARALGAAVSVGRCYEAGDQPAFAPWPDLLADLARTAGVGHGPLLPPPFGTGPPAQTAHHLTSAVAAFLRRVAAERPLVLLVEDLHWADRDAVELLEAATRSVAAVPLLVLATYRPEAAHRAHPLYGVLPRLLRDRPVEHLRLDELSVADVADLVAVRAGPGTPELAAYLHARTGGHPLFLVELLRHLVDGRLLPDDGDGRLLPPTGHVEVPGHLRHVVAHRVAALGAEAEGLLAVAAVAGEAWDLSVVEAVLGWDEGRLLGALEAVLRAEVAVPVAGGGERYRFRHALIREVLYGDQVARRRRHLHLRIAQVLEALAAGDRNRPYQAGLAYHYGMAERWEDAARAGVAAGDDARDRFAGHAAAEAYRQALAALDRAPPQAARELAVPLHERLGQAHLVVGDAGAAAAAVQRMREEARAAGDRAGEGRALAWLSYVHRRRYDPAAAHDAAAAALEIADAVGEPRLQALVHWNLAHTHEIGGNLDLSLRHGREAERLARASGARDLLGRGLQVLAQLAIWHARYPEAERYAREALDLARETRDALALAAAHWRLGIALGEAGRYGEARAVLLAGIAGAETAGERYYLAKLLNTLGWLHLEFGDAEGAERWDARALETARGSHGGRVTEAERYTLLNLTTDALAAGRIDAAAAHLDAFAPLLEHRDYGRFRYLNRYQLLRGEVALAQERHEEALRFGGEAERFAAAKEMPKNVVKGKLLTGRALLELGRVRPATATLADAVTMADRIGHGSLRWQARFWAGRATGAAGGDPAPLYAEAARLLQGLASAVDDAELRNRLLAAPSARALTIATADRDAGAAARPAGLTAREVEVLLLLASHRTNNEIADELFVSPRTVTTHVANIFNKLGVSNRRDAAEAAVRLGLPGPSRRVSPGTT